MNEEKWEDLFNPCHAYWHHSGNPKQPYAQLTKGKISDLYFNARMIVANDPALYGYACKALWYRARAAGKTANVTRVIGAAKGGIPLSARIGEAGLVKSAYANKTPDGFIFDEFAFEPHEHLMLAEDTITTGATLLSLMLAAHEKEPTVTFAPVILSLCNRSGLSELDGMPILSLVTPKAATWLPGKNPYTKDGQELVPPLPPKTHWEQLTHWNT